MVLGRIFLLGALLAVIASSPTPHHVGGYGENEHKQVQHGSNQEEHQYSGHHTGKQEDCGHEGGKHVESHHEQSHHEGSGQGQDHQGDHHGKGHHESSNEGENHQGGHHGQGQHEGSSQEQDQQGGHLGQGHHGSGNEGENHQGGHHGQGHEEGSIQGQDHKGGHHGQGHHESGNGEDHKGAYHGQGHHKGSNQGRHHQGGHHGNHHKGSQGHISWLLKPLGIFAKGLNLQKYRKSVHIFKTLSKYERVNNWDDGVNIIFGVSEGVKDVLDDWIPDLGTIFSNMIMAVFKIETCVSDTHYGHLFKVRHYKVCDQDYGKEWGCRYFSGRSDSREDIIRHYGLENIWTRLEEILLKHEQRWKSVEGSPKVIVGAIRQLAELFKQDSKTWTQEVILSTFERLCVVLGALGKSTHPELGDDAVDGFIDIFVELGKKYGWDLQSRTVKIKAEISPCNRQKLSDDVAYYDDMQYKKYKDETESEQTVKASSETSQMNAKTYINNASNNQIKNTTSNKNDEQFSKPQEDELEYDYAYSQDEWKSSNGKVNKNNGHVSKYDNDQYTEDVEDDDDEEYESSIEDDEYEETENPDYNQNRNQGIGNDDQMSNSGAVSSNSSDKKASDRSKSSWQKNDYVHQNSIGGKTTVDFQGGIDESVESSTVIIDGDVYSDVVEHYSSYP